MTESFKNFKNMKTQEFKVYPEAGVVIFRQMSHGKIFSSRTKVDDMKNFNVGIGQLIAMKRAEIDIRKEDIKSMKTVVDECQYQLHRNQETTAGKLWSNFVQITMDKIKMSYNHIRELKEDLEYLYNGTYNVKPYAEIIEEHRNARNGMTHNTICTVPQEIIDGTHMYDIVDGSVKLVKI